MKKVILILLLVLPIVNNSFSQGKVNISIDERTLNPKSGLSSKTIASHINGLLSELNRACEANETVPNFEKLFVNDLTREMIKSYWEVSSFRFDSSKNPKILEVVNRDGYFTVKVEMEFVGLREKHINKGFKQYESFTIDFNKSGIITAFQINGKNPFPHVDANIMSEERQNYIRRFVNNFARAYSYRKTDSLNKFFKSDAIIVVGKVTKVPQKIGVEPQLHITLLPHKTSEIIRLNQYTRREYFKNLDKVFGVNHYVCVQFEYEPGAISQVYGVPHLYFVQVKQYWYSSRYNDVGYLTMLWDFSDEKHPKVETRIWLPNKIQQFSKADNITVFKD